MKEMWTFSLLLVIFLLASCLNVADAGGIMGIDFGTDWFKVAVVKAGYPLDVVLNRESKRKTETIVLIKNGVRYFGSEAAALSLKRPQDSYGRLKNLLGRPFEDQLVDQYKAVHTNDLVKDEVRGTCAFKSGDQVYAVEELVAMQLAHARSQCEQYVNDKVTDAIITVPPFWTQVERKALMDAAEMAGINVISLINDETAAAINYAMTRTFEDVPQYHIFLDIGAGSTVASLMEFKNVLDKKLPKAMQNRTHIEVKSMAYDRTLGGLEIDTRLAQHLGKVFQKQTGDKKKVDVFKDPKAMARLLREANRVKHILSANTETGASVEGLISEIDFRTKITRVEMEGLIVDLVDRLESPIKEVLQFAGKELKDIKSVILVGGSMRVPIIQSKVEAVVGADKIAKHVNADEACVLGAGFRGASSNPNFRVRKIDTKDVNSHTISMTYLTASDVAEDGQVVLDANSKRTVQPIFPRFSPTNVKKKAAFKKSKDFIVDLVYDAKEAEADPQMGDLNLMRLSVTGVTDGLEKFKEMSISEPKVKVLLELNESGVVGAASAAVEVKTQKKGGIADKLRSFFGGSGEDKKDEDAVENEVKDEKNSTKPATNNSTESGADVEKLEVIDLQLAVSYLGVRPMSTEEKYKAKERLARLDQEDADRYALETGRNTLESYIYGSRDFVEKSDVVAVSSPDHREEITALVKVSGEWLSDEGDMSTNLTEFTVRYEALKTLRTPIEKRISENKCRPAKVKELQRQINNGRKLLFDEHYNVTEDARTYQDAAVTELEKDIVTVENWLNGLLEAQSKVKPYESGVLTCEDLLMKTNETQLKVRMMQFRKRPKPVVTSTTTTAAPITTTIEPGAEETEAPVTGEEPLIVEDGENEQDPIVDEEPPVDEDKPVEHSDL